MDIISLEPTQIDEIIRELRAPSSEILSAILELEPAGKVVKISGNFIVIQENKAFF